MSAEAYLKFIGRGTSAPVGGTDPMQTFSTEAAVERALARHEARPGPLLPVLHDVQKTLGHVPPAAVGRIAQALNLSRAEVHGVITFYHHFRSEPAGRHVVSICQAEACQSMGAAALTAHAERTLGCKLHATTADGAITLEPTYCLGLCALSPALSVDDDVHARITPAEFDRLVTALRRDDVVGQEAP
jgi:formate dehydrogenase subunit gamma